MTAANKSNLSLILGGVRSGKSSFALSLAEKTCGPVLFVATAEAGDDEMRARIEQHRQQRPNDWRTLEAPLSTGAAIRDNIGDVRLVLLDCVSFLVANAMGSAGDDAQAAAAAVEVEIEGLLNTIAKTSAQFIIVSNEVGLGIVPAYPSGRQFRDLLGWANQRLARAAGYVYWMVAGLPLELKASGLARNIGVDS